VPATVVVGAQWGDEGKGKIVDLLAQESDLVCRYQGGPNTGHTIVVGDDVFKIRQVPTGIIAVTVFVFGSMRATVLSVRIETQTAPLPAATGPTPSCAARPRPGYGPWPRP